MHSQSSPHLFRNGALVRPHPQHWTWFDLLIISSVKFGWFSLFDPIIPTKCWGTPCPRSFFGTFELKWTLADENAHSLQIWNPLHPLSCRPELLSKLLEVAYYECNILLFKSIINIVDSPRKTMMMMALKILHSEEVCCGMIPFPIMASIFVLKTNIPRCPT